MEWTANQMTRLYELYRQHIERLRADVTETNRSLGSSNPEKTGVPDLSRAEFESLLKNASRDPEARRLWIRRIIRGHEQEFPELESARDPRRADGGSAGSGIAEKRERGTGT